MEHHRFHIKTLDALRDEIRALDIDLPIQEHVSRLGDAVTLNGISTPNRFVAQPMEGFDSENDGGPGELTFRRYNRYAAGGFGLIWVEATAVAFEGRSNPGQLHIHKGNVGKYRDLVASIRKTAMDTHGRDVVLIIQLTHSGRYSKPTGVPKPIIAHHSPILDPKHNLPEDYPLVSDDYLDSLQDTYVSAARLAQDAGFDGVDIKSCHRYLVSELLASFTREGKYGGSFENRTRLLRETLSRIRAEVPGVFVTTRMSAFDAISHPYGFGVSKEDYRIPDLTEPLELVGQMKEIGIPLLNISIGNPYFNPHFGRPFDFPIKGLSVPDEHPLSGLARFVAVTGKIQRAYPDLPVIASGYSWLRQFVPNVASAVIDRGDATLLGLGRGAFAYPESVDEIIERGTMDPAKCCVTCSACTQIMRDGAMTGCVVRDAEIYGPQYRLGRRFALDRLQEEARRCRDCEEATCTPGCPAQVDIPTFVKAFADGDFKTAYEVLKARNVLPEMCGCVCPSEVQCEAGCIEQVFCEHPIPIRDIQLVVCRIARREGYTAIQLPEDLTDRHVAVVGGGPAGVGAAIRLLECGHRVTILDAGDKLGGTPETIIPYERYDTAQSEVDAILAPAREAGRVEIRYRTRLGADVSLSELRDDYDAVVLAPGLSQATALGEAEGVVDALTFLREAKRKDVGVKEKIVAVLGGGNTAMDAAVTAVEQGARDVYVIYRRSFGEMPAWPKERDAFMDSGGHCLILTQPIGYETNAEGRLTGLRIARTHLGAPDESGRRRPEVVAGTEGVLSVDCVVEAIGQGIGEPLREALGELRLTAKGLIEVDPSTFATSLPNIFAAGDIVSGGTTAVQGIAEGMLVADEIDALLRG